MQTGFYFDQSRCTGCYACVAACRSWNELAQDMPDPIQIVSQEQGKFPRVSLTHLFVTCFHCAEPKCVAACPDGLLVKRAEDGIVVVENAEQCTACEQCVEACPYDAPKVVSGGNTRIVKCNMCLDRLAEGKSTACVAACPTAALDVGPMDKLTAQYGNQRELEGLADFRETKPSVIFKARSHS